MKEVKEKPNHGQQANKRKPTKKISKKKFREALIPAASPTPCRRYESRVMLFFAIIGYLAKALLEPALVLASIFGALLAATLAYRAVVSEVTLRLHSAISLSISIPIHAAEGEGLYTLIEGSSC